ncbi:hypothetical protein Lepto7375DRAFT_7223 [Leptolyngbya sp. PCC 7375]|nr:hypothetical protein Lepto7375DRAFT_7223 [Leptolyngbya sp. PCC 7375]
MILLHCIRIFKRGYSWARDKPQAVGYGIIIFILGMTGLPDFIIQILGIVITISGGLASWDLLTEKTTQDGYYSD